MLGGKLKLSSQRVKVKIWGLRGAVDASNMVGWKNSGSTLQAVCFYALQDVGRLSLVVEAGKQLVLSFVSSSTRQHNNTSSRNERRGTAEQSKRNKDRRVTTAKETRVHKNERIFSFQAGELLASFERAQALFACRNAAGIYF
ncbi:hypothetical protein T4D_15400 [Trichinella pseudospiralis]|uniref:Uncharacterized protein n=1 Tax=Trichinella pseudospiralis TaxID=6337 RepID=A0A0V1FR98_TRIPS|nr:hypothetical protein T4D_15400 [Trichinella pseudospiralis]